jgi:hypothetical protein
MHDTTQLRLELPAEVSAAPTIGTAALPLLDGKALATIDLAPEWKEQQRGWPQALHPLCTYLGSLPAAVAHALIARWSRPGDVVLDPFSGRGSVPLQACLERRIGVGVDANPLAHLLTAAAVDPPSLRAALDRLTRLRIDWTLEADTWRAGAWAMTEGQDRAGAASLFHPETLAQLLFLRHRLDRQAQVDGFLLASIAGILHGRRASNLSEAMPNGFSLAPGYTSRWLAQRGSAAPFRDAFRLQERRLRHLFREGTPATRGISLQGDARTAGTRLLPLLEARALPGKVRLVVTSPPYLRVVRYGSANWLRLWLLGEDPAAVDSRLDAPPSAAASAALLRAVLEDLRPALADDAVVVVVLGEVESDRGRRLPRTVDLAHSAWEAAAEPAGYQLAGVASDAVDPARKLTRLWGDRAGQATRVDRFLVIAPTTAGRRRAIASAAIPVDWTRTVATPWSRPERAKPRAGVKPVAPLLRSAAKAAARADILAAYAADVPPGRPRLDGSAGPHEEPGPLPDDLEAAQLCAPAAGAPVPA